MTERADAIARQPVTQRAWKNLAANNKKIREIHKRQLFEADPKRGEHRSAEAAGLYLDYSKNCISDETLELLFQLARESPLQERIDAMFRGDKINTTEKRSVLHTALRAQRDASIFVDGENVVPKVHAVLDRMADFASRLRVENGRVTPVSAFGTWLTSVSEARILAR